MSAVPRHRQAPVTIRSDKALASLKRLTRDGRSQAQVIEDALEKAEAEAAPKTAAERFEEIAAIVRPFHGLPGKSFKELDDELWDEHGLPR